MQHDVQEFKCVLLEHIGRTLPRLADIFQGEQTFSNQCLDIEVKSETVQHFQEISLNVNGIDDINESISSMLQEEIMDGDNMYRTQNHGL